MKRGDDICANKCWGPHDSVARQFDLMINEQEEISLVSHTYSRTEAFRYASLGVFRRELCESEATVAVFDTPECLVISSVVLTAKFTVQEPSMNSRVEAFSAQTILLS